MNNSKIQAKVMFLGKSGVGKSSLINYLLGSNLAKVGTGKPVTEHFDKYDLNINGVPVKILDSKGLEVEEFETLAQDIQKELEIENEPISHAYPYFQFKENRINSVYTIFYCFSVKNKRIETKEIEFIKKLRNKLKHSIYIVLTNSDSLNKNELYEYENEFKKKNVDSKIFKICSVEQTKRGGKKTEPFGKEELLESMFELLRNDILDKFTYELEKSYKYEIKSIMGTIENKVYKIIDEKVGFFGVFKLGNFEEILEEISEKLKDELEKMEDEVEKRLNEIVKQNLIPLKRFFYQYKNAFFDEDEISYYDVDFNIYFIDFDIEETIEKTEIGILMEKIQNNDANLLDFLNIGWKVLTIGDTIKDLFRTAFSKFRYEINKADLKEDIKSSLEDMF